MSDMKTTSPNKSFEDFLKEQDSPIVYCTLKLDGEDFLDTSHFTLDLNQKAGTHDQFTIKVLDDALDTFEGEIMENSKQLLGKPLSIYLHNFGAVRYTFEGIITTIKNKKESGYGNLLISGFAPTILLESGKDCKSFEKNTLKQIFEKITEPYQGKLNRYLEDIHLNVKNRGLVFPYVVQYKESDFQFLQRVASRYGEWLFYDGSKLVMGAKPYEVIELQENVDLIDVEFTLDTQAQNFEYISYDRHYGDNRQKKSNQISGQTRANHLQVIALNASNSLYQNAPELHYNQEADELGKMLEVAMWRNNEAKKNVMVVKGSSRNPNVAAGRDVKLIDINDKPMETYRIMSVRHYHNGAGEYYNEFEAVPFDTWVPPYFNEDAIPVCEEQSAVVVDNNDPSGMSRIRVQFPWQKAEDESSPWLRVVTPYAGNGKGMHVIPEIGEEVIIGFENANAEKPFVLGSMYHGKALSGYDTSGNDQKVIHTRSGTKIVFNDAAGSIFIEDPSGNHWLMDGNGNINVNAVNNMSIKAGENLDIQVGGKMTTNVGSDMSTNVGANLTTGVGGNATETIAKSKGSQIGGDAKVQVTGTLTEVIDGDVVSETKSGKTMVNADGGIHTFSQSSIQQHAQSKVMNLSGEKSLSL